MRCCSRRKMKDLCLLLVGKTGHGISSTGNSILGPETFTTSGGFEQTTKTCKEEKAEVNDHNVVVVDTPGLDSRKITCHDSIKDYCSMIKQHISNGFDAILVVIQLPTRLTEEDNNVFQHLTQLFGTNNIHKHGILIVTKADLCKPQEYGDMSIEAFLDSDKNSLFKEMREKCDNRLIAFDNNSPNGIKDLLDMVANMRKQSNRFTKDDFEQAHARFLSSLGQKEGVQHSLAFDSSSQISSQEGPNTVSSVAESVYKVIHNALTEASKTSSIDSVNSLAASSTSEVFSILSSTSKEASKSCQKHYRSPANTNEPKGETPL